MSLWAEGRRRKEVCWFVRNRGVSVGCNISLIWFQNDGLAVDLFPERLGRKRCAWNFCGTVVLPGKRLMQIAPQEVRCRDMLWMINWTYLVLRKFRMRSRWRFKRWTAASKEVEDIIKVACCILPCADVSVWHHALFIKYICRPVFVLESALDSVEITPA